MIIPRITLALIAFLPGVIAASRPGGRQGSRTLEARVSEADRRHVIPPVGVLTRLDIAPRTGGVSVLVGPTPIVDSMSLSGGKQPRPFIRNDIHPRCVDSTSPECQLFRAAIVPGQDWDPSLLRNEVAARTAFRYLVPRIGLDESSSGDLAEFLRRTLLAKVLFVKFGVLFVGAAKAKEILDTVEPSRVIPEGLDEIMLITAARKRPLPDILAALRSVQSYSSSPMSDAIMLLGKSGERVHPA